jgi:NAD(P)-dependent dehydrogenase (short-subunit alcohol dehydrogenase family)
VARYLQGKVVLVTGSGSEAHRGVAVALAEAGADVAIGGSASDLAAEAALHSIANEIWALGRRSTVVTLGGGITDFAEAIGAAQEALGAIELVVRCDAVLNA